MENKKISQLDPYSGNPDSFDIPGVADGQTLKTNLGAAIQQKINSQRLLRPSDLKTVNGVPLTGPGDIALELVHPFKGWYDSLEGLQAAVGSPKVGDYAYIKSAMAGNPAAIYECATAGTWSDSGRTVDVSNVQTFETGQQVSGTGVKDLNGNNDPNAAGVLSAEAGLQVGAKIEGVTAEVVKFGGADGVVTSGKKISNTGVIGDSANESIIAIPVTGYNKVSFRGYSASAAHTYGYAVYSSGTVFDSSTLLASYPYGDSVATYKMYALDLPANAATLVCMYKKNNFPTNDSGFYGFKYRGESGGSMVEGVAKRVEPVDLVEVPFSAFVRNDGKKVDGNGDMVSLSGGVVYEIDVEGYDAVRFSGMLLRKGLIDTTLPCFAFGHYNAGQWVVDGVTTYELDIVHNITSVMEYMVNVPLSATLLRVSAVYPGLDMDFYCYLRKGSGLTDYVGQKVVTGAVRRLRLLEDVPTYENPGSAITAYIDLAGNILSSSNGKVFRYVVKRGQRFVIIVTPKADAAHDLYNVGVFGFSKTVPAVDGIVEYFVSGIVETGGSASGSDHKPSPLRMEWEAPDNGLLCYYYNQAGATIEIYLDESAVVAKTGVYDTYIEEDVLYRGKPTLRGGSGSVFKRYDLVPGVPYKVIYRTLPGQSINSFSVYDIKGNLRLSSNDANTVPSGGTVVEHIMEDLTVPEGASYIIMRFVGSASMNVGTVDVGMSALMKPLLDDGTLPKNDMVYCVSKIKDPAIVSGTEGEIVQQDVWSAWGFRLPNGHSLKGKPTPLVGHFHGTGGYVTSECLSYVYPYGTRMHELLYGEGIAVFDVNGRGVSFSADSASNSGTVRGGRQRHWGSPAAVATAKKAYEVLTERFNCRKGMVIGSTSMGGCLTEAYANTYPQDLVACYMLAPATLGIDMRGNNYANGLDIAVAWNAVGDHQGDMTLALGYTTWVTPSIKKELTVVVPPLPGEGGEPNTETFSHLVPDGSISLQWIINNPDKIFAPFPKELVIWQGTADTNVTPAFVAAFVQGARNAGSNVKLRVCPGYEHPLMDFYPEVVEYVKSKLVI